MTKRTRYTILIGLGLVGVFLAPIITLAAGFGGLDIPYWGPLVACQEDPVNNPQGVCTNLCQLTTLADHVIKFGFTILLFVIAPIMIVVGGGMILIAGASEKLLSQGKTILKGAVVGVVLALLAYTIVATFLWLIGNKSGGEGVSWPEVNCSVISPGEPPPFGGGEAGGGGQQPGGGGAVIGAGGPTVDAISQTFNGGTFWFKNGSLANPMVAQALTCTGEKYASNYTFLPNPIRITEAYPTSSPHQDERHNTGCAVDMTPGNFSDSCSTVAKLIQAAMVDCGLSVKNEYEACGGTLSELGTAPHLHVYLASCP